MIGIGVIGFGYWGPNLVRNFTETPGCRVVSVCDGDEERLAVARHHYPAIETTRAASDLIAHPRIDAVAVVTPGSSHFELALEALRAGKHVLVAKPLTTTSEEAVRLIDEAERRRLVLMVDHTYVFTGAVRKIREVVNDGGFGDIYYYDSVRVNLGPYRPDVNVIWDLAAHDLSIMDFVLGYQPCAISATGMTHVPGDVENIAYLTAFFETDMIAHIGVNWMAPVKVRQTLIGGSGKMILYDDLEPSEKVKIYTRGRMLDADSSPESVHRLLAAYRTGDMLAPRLDTTEALANETRHFAECIESGARPVTDGRVGLRVVRLLEAATRSMRDGGRSVRFEEWS
jgi:predicted dehydrogenase